MIFIAALLAGAAVFVSVTGKPKENRYHLSGDRLFDISNLDEVVETLRGALKNKSREIGISFSLKGNYMDDLSPFVGELMELALEETGKPDEGDYIRYQMGGYSFSYGYDSCPGGFLYSIQITPVYFSDADEEKLTEEKVLEIISELAFSENAGDFEKIRAVHDYLVDNVSYDSVHKNNEYYTLKSTAFGALVNRCAACQGYAAAMYRLLTEMGVGCRIITGEGMNGEKAEFHAWNIVKLGGVYYNIDVTWDDTKMTSDYFLKSDAGFAGHVRDAKFLTPDFYAEYPMSETDY